MERNKIHVLMLRSLNIVWCLSQLPLFQDLINNVFSINNQNHLYSYLFTHYLDARFTLRFLNGSKDYIHQYPQTSQCNKRIGSRISSQLKEFFFITFTVLYFEFLLLVSYAFIPSVPFSYKLHLTQICLVNLWK